MSSPLRRLCNRAGVVLGVLLAVSVPVSCGKSSQTASTAGSQNGATTAKSATATSATGAPAGASGSISSTPTAQTTSTSGGTTASTPLHSPTPTPGGRLLRRFSGYGNGRLGTIAVHARSLLSWRAGQPHIQIFTATGFMLVNSRSTTGTVSLSRGTYRGVRVSSAARWSVELRAPAP
jgi:hypothetical protein